LLPQVPLDLEMNRQDHGDNGCSAKQQDHKGNFDYH